MDSTALALALAGFGMVLILISYQRHRHARNGSALVHGMVGTVLVVLGALLFEVALNYKTYQQVQDAAPLAEITFVAQNKGFEATLMRIPGGDLQVFNLTGTHWQLSAELLHWRRLLPLFGLTHDIRLAELSSITQPPATRTTSTATPTRYTLHHDAGIALWRWGLAQSREQAWVHTETLHAGPLPLTDGQRVQVYIKHGELQLRPIHQNKRASKPPVAPVLNDRARDLLRSSDLALPDDGTQEDATTSDAPTQAQPSAP